MEAGNGLALDHGRKKKINILYMYMCVCGGGIYGGESRAVQNKSLKEKAGALEKGNEKHSHIHSTTDPMSLGNTGK